MSTMWGQVDVYANGKIGVRECSKRKVGPVWDWTATSSPPPDDVKRVMVTLDFMRPYESLEGGSFKAVFSGSTAYLIYTADLPKDKEETQ